MNVIVNYDSRAPRLASSSTPRSQYFNCRYFTPRTTILTVPAALRANQGPFSLPIRYTRKRVSVTFPESKGA